MHESTGRPIRALRVFALSATLGAALIVAAAPAGAAPALPRGRCVEQHAVDANHRQERHMSTSTDSESETRAVSAQTEPQTLLDRLLGFVPRALSSHAHIIFLACLGVYLVLLPLLGVSVSARSELIGGNYTNVTSDLGACIAAGLTVHLVKRDRRRAHELDRWFRRVHERHDALQAGIDRAVAAAERAEAAARADA